MEKRKFISAIIIILLVIIIGVVYFQLRTSKMQKDFPQTGQKTIEQVKEEYEDELFSYRGVNAVGIGLCDNTPCIKVSLEKETEESKNIPKEIDGYKVETEVVGQIKAL